MQLSFKAAARDPFHLTVVDVPANCLRSAHSSLGWDEEDEVAGGFPNEYTRINVATVVAVSSAHSGIPLAIRAATTCNGPARGK